MIIDYKKLEEYLDKLTDADCSSVYLIYGENQLIKTALKRLVEKIIPLNDKELGYEYINCLEAFDIFEIISRLSTYSMFSSKKIIVLGEINLFTPSKSDTEQILTDSIIKGFCRGSHLIITAETIDKRKKLFKTINDAGVIINCFIPKGGTRDEKKIRDETLTYIADNILSAENKILKKEAYRILCDLIGFDLAVFSDHLKKLASYVGERNEITVYDVRAVVNRTKEDPIYELTEAISTKNMKSALFYINSLFNSGFHPLSILAALINQIRKLLVIKSFINENKTDWKAGLDYNRFKKSVMPTIIDYDQKLNKLISRADFDREDKKSSLLIAKNKNKVYPIYQAFLKSENFTIQELINAFEYFAKIDTNLKSTASNPKIMLEQAIIFLCSKKR